MPSQFSGLMIGYSGLTAYQAAENTVANNAANVDTKGYSRQYVEREASNALRVYTSYGMVGTGVNVKGIEQYSNEYYDMRYWQNNADVGRYESHQTYMSRIEQYFKETSTTNGFTKVYSEDFFDGLNSLSNNPSDSSVRASFLGKAQSLSEYFNTMSNNLLNEQKAINLEIKSQAEMINKIAERIASLNQQINTIELTGAAANELRDKRALLVDQLSQIVDVEVTESPILDKGNNNKPTGANRYQVMISNSNILVDGYDYRSLDVKAREDGERRNQTDADGLYDLYWSGTGMEFSVMADNLSGSLKALFELRDGNNAEAMTGTFKSSTYDNSAGGKGSQVSMEFDVKDSKSLESIISKLNMPEEGYLRISGMAYCYSGFQIEYTADAAKATVTFFNLSSKDSSGEWKQLGSAVTPPSEKSMLVGESVDYQGIPYYQAQMNEWVRQFAYRFNDIENDGYDSYGNKMEISFYQWQSVDGKYHDLDEISSTDTVMTVLPNDTDNEKSYYYKMQAKNFHVNPDIMQDPGKMTTTASEQSDIDKSATDIVKKLLDLKIDKSAMTFRGASSDEFLTCVLSDIALNSESAKTFQTNSVNIQRTIENQRQSVSGVDDDEEALDLIKFQNAYNLNSKIIQVMTEIYDRLILQTGV